MRTLKELAQEAIDVQNACNILGISQSFAEAMVDLRKVHPNSSSDSLATNAITVMWAYKISLMACLGGGDTDTFTDAYRACREMAAK